MVLPVKLKERGQTGERTGRSQELVTDSKMKIITSVNLAFLSKRQVHLLKEGDGWWQRNKKIDNHVE